MKKIIIGGLAFLLIVLLIPISIRREGDRSATVRSILYQVEWTRTLNPDLSAEREYVNRVSVKLLGMDVFDHLSSS